MTVLHDASLACRITMLRMDMAYLLLTMTRSELSDLRGRIVKLKKEARSLSEELSGYSNGGQSDGGDPIAKVEAAYDCLDDAYLGFSADSDWVDVEDDVVWGDPEPDAKAGLTKAALASQLGDLGIKVVAGQVRKSDIRKVLASEVVASDTRSKKAAAHWIDQVKKIVNESQAGKVDGKIVDGYTASAVDSVYENLSSANQEKFRALPFLKAVDITWKLIKKSGK